MVAVLQACFVRVCRLESSPRMMRETKKLPWYVGSVWTNKWQQIGRKLCIFICVMARSIMATRSKYGSWWQIHQCISILLYIYWRNAYYARLLYAFLSEPPSPWHTCMHRYGLSSVRFNGHRAQLLGVFTSTPFFASHNPCPVHLLGVVSIRSLRKREMQRRGHSLLWQQTTHEPEILWRQPNIVSQYCWER